MIAFPIFTRLKISEFAMFPGENNEGIDCEFPAGVTLIAGVNGLGKTTLLTMLLRALTGPFDLSGDGSIDKLDVVLPPEPVSLKVTPLRFFAQRVADEAKSATATVEVWFDEQRFIVERKLSDLSLVSLSQNGRLVELASKRVAREAEFQALLCEAFGLSSFIDVLLILHHVVFFTERRTGALWDPNAQRQVLRALFFDVKTASKIVELERKVQSFDSLARNLSTRAFNFDKDLRELRIQEAVSPKVRSELEAEQVLLDADLLRREELEFRLSELDEERRKARQVNEQAKLNREESQGAVEQLKYTALLRLFPTMDDAARFSILRIVNQGECLVCGADASEKKAELERLIATGCCPACGSKKKRRPNVIAASEIENARLDKAIAKARTASIEEQAAASRLSDISKNFANTVEMISSLSDSIESRTSRTQVLRRQLPSSSMKASDLERLYNATRVEQRRAEAQREKIARALRLITEKNQVLIAKQSERIANAFSGYVATMIAEDATLVRVDANARLTQGGGGRFGVLAFTPEMTGATKAGLSRRNEPSDVSESQRELFDLAFRLALIDASTSGDSCSIIMETPEASLDELSMGRVGEALYEFSRKSANRLIVTNNLTNSGIVTAMFGGVAKTATESKRRQGRVLNLLQLAAPNAAVRKDGKRYNELLALAVTGRPNA